MVRPPLVSFFLFLIRSLEPSCRLLCNIHVVSGHLCSCISFFCLYFYQAFRGHAVAEQQTILISQQSICFRGMPIPGTTKRAPALARLSIPASSPAKVTAHPLPLPPPAASTASAASEVADLAELEKISTLGHGSGGVVYKVRHRKTGAVYALKVIKGDHEDAVRQQIMRETDILRRTDSPYVVRCHGAGDRAGAVHFVLEYMDGGSLEHLTRRARARGRGLSEAFLATAAAQVLRGLAYLHGQRIVHRDIKPSNLLLDATSRRVKIADFGVSRIVSRSMDPCNTYVGTCAYMSPERFDPDSYGGAGGAYDGFAGDIWSLGLTLLECFTGHLPLVAPGQLPDWAALMCAICYGDPPSAPAHASPEFRSFIDCCLRKDARHRWNAFRLLSHPFVASARSSALLFDSSCLP